MFTELARSWRWSGTIRTDRQHVAAAAAAEASRCVLLLFDWVSPTRG